LEAITKEQISFIRALDNNSTVNYITKKLNIGARPVQKMLK
jgi:hypothetical protein